MRILKLEAEGIFSNSIKIEFLDKLILKEQNLKASLYNCKSLNGKISSGKSRIMRLIELVLGIINYEYIDSDEYKYILNNIKELLKLKVYVLDKDSILKLEISIKKLIKHNYNEKIRYVIAEEKIWKKDIEIESFNGELETLFKNDDLKLERKEELTDEQLFLKDDVSMIIALNKGRKDYVGKLIDKEDFSKKDNLPIEILNYFDKNIKSLKTHSHMGREQYFEIEYKNKETLYCKEDELCKYISKGTIRGTIILNEAKKVLKNGGVLLIDDIEQNLSNDVIDILIKMFEDKRINKKNAIMIFSSKCKKIKNGSFLKMIEENKIELSEIENDKNKENNKDKNSLISYIKGD